MMLAALAAALLAAGAPLSPPQRSHDPWTLVWSDEFDGVALDAAKWRAENASVMNNQELQHYTPDAITVRDGLLTIRAEKRALRGRDYTSGLIDTRGRFSMAFGKFECRAKLPRGQGMWPAVWMLPEDDRWPPEIDIMEALGHEPRRIHTTHHWGPSWPDNQKTTAHFDGPDYTQDFHTFGVVWEPGSIEWYIDGELKFTSTANIPQDPFYFIINLAVGGNWGGNPDATTQFPQELQLDWVRAYRPSEGSDARLLLDSRHGEIVPDAGRWAFAPGEKTRLRAEPDIGYAFKRWTGDASGDASPLEVTVSRHMRIAAEFEPIPDGPRLLSAGRPVRASDSEGWGLEPERALDASLWTRWSARSADPIWLEVDLGQGRGIEAVRLAGAGILQAPYRIEVSDDRAHWKRVTDDRRATRSREKILGLDARGRYVRLFVEASGSTAWCSLFAFEVYGR